MRKLLAWIVVGTLATLGPVGLATSARAADTGNADPQAGKIVSDEPGSNAPNIQDGTVWSVAKVGNFIVVGGQFTTARNFNTSTDIPRANLLAFDATTGQIVTTFAPNPDGLVYKVLPASDGHSVYVAGTFNNAGGKATPGHVFKVDVATGTMDPTFNAVSTDGSIRDLELIGNHLFLAGRFTKVHGVAQAALATIYANTGLRDPYVTTKFTGQHHPETGSRTDLRAITTNRANTELVAVGNFTAVNGQARSQIVRLNIRNIPTTTSTTIHPVLSGWSTQQFTQSCSTAFETYMTDVEYPPTGNYFFVSTTGGWGGPALTNAGNSGCDVVARFADDATANAKPTWTDYTGGDTTWSIEATDDVVYAGGHERWWNNPGASDAAGPGAVPREGIAALDVVDGLPFSWNPTRSRGVGVRDMLATSDGLYVGSDTTLIGHTSGNQFHARIAVLPLAGGETIPRAQSRTLPTDVYQVASGGSQLVKRSGFTGTTAGAPTNAPAGPSWGTSTGAFMVNGVLYLVTDDGNVTRQTFDGSTYGTSTPVNTADQVVPQSVWHADAAHLQALFYDNGNIYYTKAGQNALFRRSFQIEDDVVGQVRYYTRSTSLRWSNVRGAFVVGNRLYFATLSGAFYRATWAAATHTVVAGTVTHLATAGTGWSSRALFPYQQAPPG